MTLCVPLCNFSTDDGISIPCSYTSYVVPISSPKLHADLTSTEIKQKVQCYWSKLSTKTRSNDGIIAMA